MRKNQALQSLIKGRAEVLFLEYVKKGNSAETKKILNGNIEIDINTHSNDGYTALHYAMDLGFDIIVKALVEHKADPFLKTKNGKMPQDLAAEKGNLVLLKLYKKFLSEQGIQIELPTSTDILRSNAGNIKKRSLKSQSVLRSSDGIKNIHKANHHDDSDIKNMEELKKSSSLGPGLRKINSSVFEMNNGALTPSPIRVIQRNKTSPRERRPNRHKGTSQHVKSAHMSLGRTDAINTKLSTTKNSQLHFLTKSEQYIASNDPHLCGLIQQLTDDSNNNLSDYFSFSNLAYGSLLCNLEEIIRKASKNYSDIGELSLLLRSFGMKSNSEIKKYSDQFQIKSCQISENLVDEYYSLANNDDQLDEIIIDPDLAENYVKLMELASPRGKHHPNVKSHNSEGIMRQLRQKHSGEVIQLRRSGSSSQLVHYLDLDKFVKR